MPVMKISDGFYSVGVQNPNLRVFDIIMKTEFGTTYNAYLVRGSKKTALIETVHKRFFDEHIENIQEVCDISKIDYIILNHCEPDHSGSLAALLKLNPDITVVASVPGIKYLSAITNTTFNAVAAKDGDKIDLGGRELVFITAPFLHWPDSMFTYSEADKALFSCDFFGAHYCEPRLVDKYIKYPADYEKAFENYYKAIFSPFRSFVVAGLEKVDKLNIQTICTSHGPILTESIEAAKEKYRRWSAESPVKDKTALILYVSAYGCTKALAETARDILIKAGYETEMLNIIEHDSGAIKEKIDSCSVLMLGSPTINKDALKPVWDIVSSIDAIKNKGKLCGVFGSYGWSGEGVPMLAERLRSLNLNVYGDGVRANFVPSENELKAMSEYTEGLISSRKQRPSNFLR
ncbi:MAG: Flavo-diiron protein FprA2 [Firmicutes bacterium ADurb.Bin193]|nr:MAG: Flavo-diiron protein FprA2 [Firmicutes bacterium ADurb.Bin193]